MHDCFKTAHSSIKWCSRPSTYPSDNYQHSRYSGNRRLHFLAQALQRICPPTEFLQQASPSGGPINVHAELSHIVQVYSPEVLLTFGQALVSLLRNVSLYMRAMEAAGLSHDAGEWLPRLVFLLLQNPLNGTLPLPAGAVSRQHDLHSMRAQ